jgi:hypothetical protein
MQTHGEKPVTRVGTRTHRTRKTAAEKARKRDRKATEQYLMAKFVRGQQLSLRKLQAALKEEILEGRLRGKLPSHETIRKWLQMDEDEMAQGALAFREKSTPGKKRGRPRKKLAQSAEKKVQEQILAQTAPSLAAITRAAAEAHDEEVANARARGETLDAERPTYAHVHHRAEDQDLAEKSASRQGSRAADFDTLPRSSVPVKHAHDCWQADEFNPPVFVRFPLRGKKWIALKPKVAFSIDNATRALPSYHVANMTKLGYAGSLDSDEFRAMLVNASTPELAQRFSPACLPYAGFLPREIRWDLAAIHTAADTMMKAAGVVVPSMPGANPPERGLVERAVDILQAGCWQMRGYDPTWKTVESMKEHPKSARTKGAATVGRLPTHMSLRVEDLLDYDEFCEQFDKVVGQYHHLELNTEENKTRDQLYFERFREDRAIQGRAIALGLPPHACTVDQYLTHRRERFPVVFGGMRLKVGALTTFHPDPLLRGIFTNEFTGSPVFLPAVNKGWAEEQNANEFTKTRQKTARAASDAGAAVRDEMRKEELGEETVSLTDAAFRDKFPPPAPQEAAPGAEGAATKPASADKKTRPRRSRYTGAPAPSAPASRAPTPARSRRTFDPLGAIRVVR